MPGSTVVDNASAVIERAASDGRSLVVLRQAGDVAPLSPPAAFAAAWRSDLDAGYLVVAAPPAPASVAEGGAVWWRVDGESGVPLGVDARGQGQGMTEEQILNTVIVFMGAAWCELKVARKDLNEYGQFVGFSVCIVGWATGMVGVFAAVPAAVIIGMAAGFWGDICDTN